MVISLETKPLVENALYEACMWVWSIDSSFIYVDISAFAVCYDYAVILYSVAELALWQIGLQEEFLWLEMKHEGRWICHCSKWWYLSR